MLEVTDGTLNYYCPFEGDPDSFGLQKRELALLSEDIGPESDAGVEKVILGKNFFEIHLSNGFVEIYPIQHFVSLSYKAKS